MTDNAMMNDHARGCQGREYTCTCGYDDERDAEITRLRSALSEAEKERDDWRRLAGARANNHEALEAELAQARNKALEEAAKVAEAPISGQTFDRFMINGHAAANTSGHDVFMSVSNVDAMLGQRADAIRALLTDTGRTEGERG